MDQIQKEENQLVEQEYKFSYNNVVMDGQTQEMHLSILNSIIYNIFHLKEAIYRSKKISKQGLHNAMKLIEQSIYKLRRIQLYFKYNQDNNNQVNIIKRCSVIRWKLNQWLKDEEGNNDEKFDQIKKLINEINQSNEDNKQNCSKFRCSQYVVSTINKYGTTFAFNQKATIIFVNNQIYGFNNNHKLIKTLEQKDILQLIWMKNSESLLTGSKVSMIIWNNNWQPQFILKEQTPEIHSMIVNKEENLIISGNSETISFWGKKLSRWICQQSITTNIYNCNLSLNSTQNKFISCGYEKEQKIQVYIIELQDNQQWSIAQRLGASYYGSGTGLYFTNNDQFIFNHLTQGYLSIFNYEKETNQFFLNNLLILPCHQSTKYLQKQCHFINQEKVLIVSCDDEIYFISFDQNGEYKLYQYIKLGNYRELKSSTDDRQYLVIRKRKSTESIEIVKIRQRN